MQSGPSWLEALVYTSMGYAGHPRTDTPKPLELDVTGESPRRDLPEMVGPSLVNEEFGAQIWSSAFSETQRGQ